MNVPLFNGFLCCKMSVGTKAGVRILKHRALLLPLTCCGPCAVGTCFTPDCEVSERRPKFKLLIFAEWVIKNMLLTIRLLLKNDFF